VVISGHPRSSAAIRGHQKSSVVISVHYDEPGDKLLGVVVDILADEPCLSSIVKGDDHRVRYVRGLDAVDVQLEQLEGRQSMAINGNQWQSMAINGNQWQSMAIDGNQWQSMAIDGKQWQSMGRSVALNSHSVHAHIISTSLSHHEHIISTSLAHH
jgi:hypothetical protein